MKIDIALKFKDVNKAFSNQNSKALNNISFEIRQGEFITILGSSGSGKTTLLKTLNRLVEPDSGNIYFNGEDILTRDVTELRRQMGYVVQDISLFPHMTIAENISVVPKLLEWSEEKINERTNELLNVIKLPPEEYANRKPSELSGGQQQRVGVARALAANPKVMLMDEPFGALDAITRIELQAEIISLHKKMPDKTFIFVTHDINEAFRLGTKVMIMNEGTLEQFDTPKKILNSPKTEFVNNLIQTVRKQEAFWSDLND